MDQRTRADSPTKSCTVDGCDRPLRARGMCGSHYNQTYQKGRHPKQVVPCAACGKLVEKYPSGKRKATCSQRCRYVITYGRDISEGREVVGPVPKVSPPAKQSATPRLRFVGVACGWCGERFIFDLRITGTVARFCSRRCGKASHKQARGQFSISPVRRLAIYERDGWTCQLCGDPVDRALGPSDAWGATLDHIECQSWTLVPDHSEANLRLAHRMCNSVRGDRDDAIERNFVPSHSGMAQSLRIGTQ